MNEYTKCVEDACEAEPSDGARHGKRDVDDVLQLRLGCLVWRQDDLRKGSLRGRSLHCHCCSFNCLTVSVSLCKLILDISFAHS